jgi:aspartate/methionine/tyrosine aminotransferase
VEAGLADGTEEALEGAVEALWNEESAEASAVLVQGYWERHGVMPECIRRSDFLSCQAESRGAFYCSPRHKPTALEVQLAKHLLEQAAVATVPGSTFGGCREEHLRLSYSTQPGHIVEALKAH